MNFIKYYIDTKVVISPTNKDITIPDHSDFKLDGNKQLSKDLDRFLHSYYKADLFDNCRISDAVFESLRCVLIMLENILETIDERNPDYEYWKKLSLESQDLEKELTASWK